MSQIAAQDRFVIGVDAGGTYTRVGCFDLEGHRLGFAVGGGGSAHHNDNDDARDNVRSTIVRALEAGRLKPAGAVALVAGMAGVNRSESNQTDRYNKRTMSFVDADGLSCPKLVVNDAVIAHRGALSGRAGIVVVAGTGSMILAIDAAGVETESGQFEHYAGAARHLVHDVVQRILIGEGARTDPLQAAALTYFGVADVEGLRGWAMARAADDHNESTRAYGGFAPQVTALAGRSALADAALRGLAGRTARGVLLLVPDAGDRQPVPVACAGSLAVDPSFRDRLEQALTNAGPRLVEVVPSRLDPLGGAAVTALKIAGVGPSDAMSERLAGPTGKT
jgi:glucosamine kinase